MLLRRFGLYGVRVAVDQLRRNPGCSTIDLVRALRAASGVDELVVTIEREFGARAAVLRARSVLLSLETIADEVGGDAGQQLHRDLEQRWGWPRGYLC